MTTDRTTNWAKNLLTGGHHNAKDDDDLERPARAQPRVLEPRQPASTRVDDSPPVNAAALAKALLAQRLKKRSRFSEPDKAKIFGRFLQGEHPDEIGASFGVSGMAIRKLVDDAIIEGGLEPPKRGKRKPKPNGTT